MTSSTNSLILGIGELGIINVQATNPYVKYIYKVTKTFPTGNTNIIIYYDYYWLGNNFLLGKSFLGINNVI